MDRCQPPRQGLRAKNGHHSTLTVMTGHLINIPMVDLGTTIIVETRTETLKYGATQRIEIHAGNTVTSVNRKLHVLVSKSPNLYRLNSDLPNETYKTCA